MKNSDIKSKVRQSKEWKAFRQVIKQHQNNKDYLTGFPLHKGFQVHHCCMKTEEYDKYTLDNMYALNRLSHSLVHDLFRYYSKDRTILKRLKKILDKMIELNK